MPSAASLLAYLNSTRLCFSGVACKTLDHRALFGYDWLKINDPNKQEDAARALLGHLGFSREDLMPIRSEVGIRRRTLLKAGLAAGVLQVASPFVLRARAADVVKIGLDNPLTGAS